MDIHSAKDKVFCFTTYWALCLAAAAIAAALGVVMKTWWNSVKTGGTWHFVTSPPPKYEKPTQGRRK